MRKFISKLTEFSNEVHHDNGNKQQMDLQLSHSIIILGFFNDK